MTPELIERACSRRLVGTPPQQSRAVPEAAQQAPGFVRVPGSTERITVRLHCPVTRSKSSTAMIELKTGAAYIRTSGTAAFTDSHRRPHIEREVLALLDTAHTAESLSRRISQDTNAQIGAVRQDVESAMRRLLNEELIELSPDS